MVIKNKKIVGLRLFLSFLIIVVIGIEGLLASHLEPIVLEGSHDGAELNVSAHIGLYADSIGHVSVTRLADNAFLPADVVLSKINPRKIKKYIFYFKTEIRNNSEDTLRFFFRTPDAGIVTVHVAGETKDGGDLSPPDSRDERFMPNSFGVVLNPHQTVPIRGKMEYARLRKKGFEHSFYLQQEEHARSAFFGHSFRPIEYKFILLSTGFLFSIGFVLVFMILHYVQTRDKLYLYYSSYLFTVVLYSMIDFEAIAAVNIPFFGHFNRLYFFRHPLGLIINGTYFYFVSEFLDLKTKMPLLYKVFTYLIYFLYFNVVLGLILGWGLGYYSLESQIYFSIRFIWFIPSVVFLVLIWREQLKYGKIILLGTMVLLLGTLISLVMSVMLKEYDSFWKLPIIYTQYAILVEIAFFSLGVGKKIREGEKERLAGKEELIQRLKENAELQDQVNSQLQESVQLQVTLAEKSAIELEKEKAVSQSNQLQKQLAEMELLALRSQMNPHFIFNSLNSIKSYILKSGPLEASEYLTNFSNLIRSILQNSKSSQISLKDELDTLLLYVKLEQMRFPEKFQFTFFQKSSISMETIMVPPLILQPYVENAIWHGLLHLDKKGLLKIEVLESEKGCLTVIIEDNGIGRKRAEELKAKSLRKYKSMGMGITKSRIDLHNEINAKGIKVEVSDIIEDKNTGTRVEIVVLCPQNKETDESNID